MEQAFCIIDVLFDAAGNAVDYRFLEINPVFEKQTGLKNAVGKTMRELEPAHEDHWFRIYGEVARSRQSRHFENEAAKLASGVWYEVFAHPFGASDSNQVALFFYDITDHKKAQEALRRSEERLRSFIAASSNMVYRMSADWSRMEHLTGKELLSDTTEPTTGWIDKYILPEDRPFVQSVIKEAISSKSVFELEHRVIQADGSSGWLLSRAVPIFDEQGAIAEWFGTGTDTTERRKTEEALRQSEEKYRSIFNSIGEGFCIYELIYGDDGQPIDLKWIEVNPAYERQTGLKDTVGKLHKDLSLDTESYWLEIYDKVAKTGDSADVELWHEPTGRWYRTFSSRIGEAGSALIAVVFDDVTERKNRELQQAFLLELTDALRPLGDPTVIQQTAMQVLGKHLNVHRAFYGEMQDDGDTLMIGPGYAHDVFPLEGAFSFSAFNLDAVGSYYLPGQTLVFDDVNSDKRFSEETRQKFDAIKVSAAVAVPLVKSDKVQALLNVHQSVPRRWTATEIALVEETADRTWAAVERARTEESLRYNEQQLLRLLKLRDEFIGVASHELKTPVTSILAFAEVVQERLEASANERDAAIVKQLNVQIQRLTSLINLLLDTTRIAEGQLKLTIELVDINRLIHDRIEEIRRTTTHRFEFKSNPVAPIPADAERIGQVITNLLSNAVKYSPRDTSVYVTAEQTGNNLRVSVRDEGYGISIHDQKKIFDRFYRVTANNMDTFPGMGLGLYITAKIIERHRGFIGVKSEPGKGAIFTFTLPYQ